MRIWIDTEFNGFRGELISLALVAEDGSMFYIVRKELENMDLDPWVKENVIPYLKENPEGFDIEWSDDTTSKHILQNFLGKYHDIEIIADWPEDIAHLCQFLITGPGYCITTPWSFKFTLDRTIDTESEVPHNALYDAIANMEETLNQEMIPYG